MCPFFIFFYFFWNQLCVRLWAAVRGMGPGFALGSWASEVPIRSRPFPGPIEIPSSAGPWGQQGAPQLLPWSAGEELPAAECQGNYLVERWTQADPVLCASYGF